MTLWEFQLNFKPQKNKPVKRSSHCDSCNLSSNLLQQPYKELCQKLKHQSLPIVNGVTWTVSTGVTWVHIATQVAHAGHSQQTLLLVFWILTSELKKLIWNMMINQDYYVKAKQTGLGVVGGGGQGKTPIYKSYRHDYFIFKIFKGNLPTTKVAFWRSSTITYSWTCLETTYH